MGGGCSYPSSDGLAEPVQRKKPGGGPWDQPAGRIVPAVQGETLARRRIEARLARLRERLPGSTRLLVGGEGAPELPGVGSSAIWGLDAWFRREVGR
jgi:hypothetical protein